jgi:hypothetical protein
MPFNKLLYPPDWDALRDVKLKEAGYRCQECGVTEQSERISTRTGRKYLVYLSVAHKRLYETWKRDAETMVLCQLCHRRYDRQFSRKGGYLMTRTPLGYAKVYASLDGQRVLVGMPQTYSDLSALVLVLPDTAEFEVQLVMHFEVVGGGYFQREEGRNTVLEEYGVCQRLLF